MNECRGKLGHLDALQAQYQVYGVAEANVTRRGASIDMFCVRSTKDVSNQDFEHREATELFQLSLKRLLLDP